MPKFFFDIIDGETVTSDQIGLELEDDNVARIEATKALSEIAGQELPGDGPHRHFGIIVRDHQGAMLFEVQLTFSTVEGKESASGGKDGSGH